MRRDKALNRNLSLLEQDAKINSLLNDILILNNNVAHHQKEVERLLADLQQEKQQHLLLTQLMPKTLMTLYL